MQNGDAQVMQNSDTQVKQNGDTQIMQNGNQETLAATIRILDKFRSSFRLNMNRKKNQHPCLCSWGEQATLQLNTRHVLM